MEKEFIPYEQALALKELGFNRRTIAQYNTRQGDEWILTFDLSGEGQYPNNSSACITPTFSQAFRWFREKHGINSTIDNDLYEDDNHIVYSYNLSRISTADDLIELDEDDFVDTYEQAELECLKKLIEIVKTK